MTSRFDSPRDPILKILSERGGKMERKDLRRELKLRIALLNQFLDELTEEGKIGYLEKPFSYWVTRCRILR